MLPPLELISNVLQLMNSAFGGCRCIHLAVEDAVNLNSTATFATVIKPFDAFKSYPSDCQPDAYGVITENVTKITHIFINNSLVPHKKLLVFSKTPLNYTQYPIDAARRLWNVDTRDYREFTSIDDDNWVPQFKNNETLRISVFDNPPFTYINESTFYDGTDKCIIDHIIDKWPIEIIYHPHNSWGALREYVYSNKTDVSLSGMYLETLDLNRCDAVLIRKTVCFTFLVPRPKPYPIEMFIFQIFTPHLHFICWTTLLVIAVVLRQLQTATNKSLLDNIILLFKISTGNSPQCKSFNTPIRLLVMSWIVTTMICNVFYSAGITNTLSFPRFEQPINSLSDVVRNNLHWLVAAKTIPKLLEGFPNDHARKLAREAVMYNEVKSFEGYVHTAQMLGHFITENNYLNEDDMDELMFMKNCIGHYFIAYPMVKNSPFIRLFQQQVNKMSESGLLSKCTQDVLTRDWKSQIKSYAFLTIYPEPNGPNIFTMAHLSGGIIVLVVGYLLGAMVFVYEVLLSKYKII